MDTTPAESDRALALAELREPERRRAQERFAVLRPHLEDGVPAQDAAI
ncbi:hypothetical protein BC739_009383 [Kutzneria viridogrisea]|uniref:Uncharacterized protein n=1 Tax=Kutzneria viridogrisea TaxID=47990 RepID=A0ABR6BZY7_9PSEU|nr:hypothetical protein [Kutzneria viridogrisea]